MGKSPILYAAVNNLSIALNSLIHLNIASINVEDQNQNTVLMYILLAEPFDRKFAKKIVEVSHADVNHVDLYGRSILIKLVKLKKKK